MHDQHLLNQAPPVAEKTLGVVCVLHSVIADIAMVLSLDRNIVDNVESIINV